MDEKIFRKKQRDDENLSDFCIFYQFLLKNHYLPLIIGESPKLKIEFFEGFVVMSHFFNTLWGSRGVGDLYKALPETLLMCGRKGISKLYLFLETQWTSMIQYMCTHIGNHTYSLVYVPIYRYQVKPYFVKRCILYQI